MNGEILANKRGGRVRKHDYYPTPPEATQALIDTQLIPKDGVVWECACGEGYMSKVFEGNGYTVLSSDIEDYGYGQVFDFLGGGDPVDVKSIVTNPPFNISEDFIKKALSLDVGVVAFLFKSQYWHAKKRIAIWEKYTPSYVFLLTWRPDFLMGKGGNAPTMECLWTVWIKGNTDTKLKLLRKPTQNNQRGLF